jgi:amino acid transporter
MAEIAITSAEAGVDQRELLKVLRWWDGLALGLTVPASTFAVIGFSIGTLGAWGAFTLWAISSFIAALQAWIYTETAAMFPDKPGGISLYAHEGWRKYSTLVGPVASFGYWFAWSSVLAIFGLTIGNLFQAQWFPGSTWSFYTGAVHFGLPHLVAIVAIVIVWLFNVLGIRPTVAFQYAIGILLIVPFAAFTFVPFLTGDFHSSNATWNIGAAGQPWGGVKVAIVWLYLMAWSTYSSEICASFAPEYKDVTRDTARALKGTALFIALTFSLMPLAITGTIGIDAVNKNPTTFYIDAFNTIIGPASDFMVVLIILAFLLVMNGSTADGSRALYGIAKDDMTVKQLFHLNRFNVPARAMTLDLVVNTLLVLFVGNILAILVAGNLGYVAAHFFALSGFLLLRRDRPNWPRPIKMGSPWLVVAAVLVIVNLVFIVIGASSSDLTGYGGTKETAIGVGVLGISILLFLFRRVVQDRKRVQFREETPTMPGDAVSALSGGGD